MMNELSMPTDIAFRKNDLLKFGVRPNGNPRKADKLLRSIMRQTNHGQPLSVAGAKVDRYLRMTTAGWELNGSIAKIRDMLQIPYGNGLPMYDGNGEVYLSTSKYELCANLPSVEEAREAMHALCLENRELMKVAMDRRTHGERCIDAADTLIDAIEDAYPRYTVADVHRT